MAHKFLFLALLGGVLLTLQACESPLDNDVIRVIDSTQVDDVTLKVENARFVDLQQKVTFNGFSDSLPFCLVVVDTFGDTTILEAEPSVDVEGEFVRFAGHEMLSMGMDVKCPVGALAVFIVPLEIQVVGFSLEFDSISVDDSYATFNSYSNQQGEATLLLAQFNPIKGKFVELDEGQHAIGDMRCELTELGENHYAGNAYFSVSHSFQTKWNDVILFEVNGVLEFEIRE